MKLFRLTPKVIFWWGLVIAVGGSLLVLLVPLVLNVFTSGPTGITRDFLVAIEVTLRVAQSAFPPLGSALVGAALVMFYLDKSGLGSNQQR